MMMNSGHTLIWDIAEGRVALSDQRWALENWKTRLGYLNVGLSMSIVGRERGAWTMGIFHCIHLEDIVEH
jgi:hypothetical protein